ncbi:MAG TPA: hypothetical protein VD866_32535 [Urbifossiella sp.]|nr:hypothetical protein [Urbifossiella sp.]
MRTTLARRAYSGTLGLLSAAIAALAYLLAQPGGHARTPEPVAPDNTLDVVQPVGVEPPSPDFAWFLRPRLGSELLPRETLPDTIAVAPPPREQRLPPLEGSAIGAVVLANGGRLPATGAELRRALDRLGDFVQLPVAFSAVALDSGLVRPRVVMTPHPKALADAPPDGLNLVGRLFLAANTATDERSETPYVTSVEFISWNSRRARFDFGVIEGMGGRPELKLLDGARCFSCHKTRAPILGVAPWSNTAHDPTVQKALRERFGVEIPGGKSDGSKVEGKRPEDIDGLSLFTPRASEVDTAVRLAGGMLRDREVFRALSRSWTGRLMFARLLLALARPGPLAEADAQLEAVAARTDLNQFASAAAAIYQSAPSTRLVDFDPSNSFNGPFIGPPGPTPNPFAWQGVSGPWRGGNVNLVASYESERAKGNHGMSSDQFPSNPKAFVRPTAPKTFTGVAGASVLARTIGLTDPDRRFLVEALARASATTARRPAGPVLPGTLAAKVFAGPSFADVRAGGELPDRDDFKDRFVAGLTEVLERYGSSRELPTPRETYTSGPRRGPAESAEVELVPTTACLRCHDVRTPGRKSEFNPIPQLAFDPFDRAGREAWVKSADSRTREAVLGRMLRRVGTDRDMPPTDAAEYTLFRANDPAAFDAVSAFLEAELRKAKSP